jgi:hypothetical protein
MKKMKLCLLYSDAGNYKTRFDIEVDIEKYPKAVELKVGDEIIMGEYGTLSEDDFFLSDTHPYKYSKRYDHNILVIEDLIEL